MRARGIKPGFFKNELLGTCNPLTAMLFAGLWMLADREGRLEDRPLRIKAEIFPYRESLDIHGSLTELVQMGFICRYETQGCAVIQINNFRKHQTPHKTEKLSALPVPSDNMLNNNTTRSDTVKPPDKDDGLPEVLPPDLLTPDLLTPDSPQQVGRAPEAAEQRDDFFEKCYAFITARFPLLVPSSSAPIYLWEKAGYDFETQVKPIVESAAAKAVKVKSFNYFTSSLEELASKKLTVMPKEIKVSPEQVEANRQAARKFGIAL